MTSLKNMIKENDLDAIKLLLLDGKDIYSENNMILKYIVDTNNIKMLDWMNNNKILYTEKPMHIMEMINICIKKEKSELIKKINTDLVQYHGKENNNIVGILGVFISNYIEKGYTKNLDVLLDDFFYAVSDNNNNSLGLLFLSKILRSPSFKGKEKEQFFFFKYISEKPGVNIHQKNIFTGKEYDYNLLIFAAAYECPMIAQYLLDKGISLYERGEEAVNRALKYNNQAIIELFVKHGLDIGIKLNHYVKECIFQGNVQSLEYIESRGGNILDASINNIDFLQKIFKTSKQQKMVMYLSDKLPINTLELLLPKSSIKYQPMLLDKILEYNLSNDKQKMHRKHKL